MKQQHRADLKPMGWQKVLSLQSQRKNTISFGAIQRLRRTAERRNGTLLQHAKHSSFLGQWTDVVWKTIHPIKWKWVLKKSQPIFHLSQKRSERPNTSKPIGKHNDVAFFPKIWTVKFVSSRKLFELRARTARKRNSSSTTFWRCFHGGSQNLSEENKSRLQHRYAVAVQDHSSSWIQSYPKKNKTAQETMNSLRMFVPPDQKPSTIITSNSLEFLRACEAEQSVSRVREGTSALLVQSCLSEKWCREARFGTPFDGPVIQLGSSISSQSPRKTKVDSTNSVQRCFQENFHRIRIEFWRRLDRRLDQRGLARHREQRRFRSSRQKIQAQRIWNQELAVGLFVYSHVLTQMVP